MLGTRENYVQRRTRDEILQNKDTRGNQRNLNQVWCLVSSNEPMWTSHLSQRCFTDTTGATRGNWVKRMQELCLCHLSVKLKLFKNIKTVYNVFSGDSERSLVPPKFADQSLYATTHNAMPGDPPRDRVSGTLRKWDSTPRLTGKWFKTGGCETWCLTATENINHYPLQCLFL